LPVEHNESSLLTPKLSCSSQIFVAMISRLRLHRTVYFQRLRLFELLSFNILLLTSMLTVIELFNLFIRIM